MSAAVRKALSLLPALLLVALCACDQERRPPPAQAPQPTTPTDSAPATREERLVAHVAQHPDDVAALLALANYYYDADRPHRAAPLYLEALKHRPDDPAVRTDLGTCYKNMGLLDKAAAEYQRVLRDHPDHLQATFNLAVVSKLAGDEARAAQLWERAAALSPGTAVAQNALQLAAEARRGAQPNTAPAAGKDSAQ